MPTVITNLVATTELDAVNLMLRAIGQAPIADVSASTLEDVTLAVGLLKDNTREVLSAGWRFNTEFGLQLSPSVTFATWADPDGTVQTLNIFKPDSKLISFTVSEGPAQLGSKKPDVVIRPSKQYQEASAPVLVFYERATNRDGLIASDYPYLFIDAVWLFDFEQLPETARKYITVRAARQFIEQTVGSTTMSGFTEKDEIAALRNLKREQGETDRYSLLNNADIGAIRAYRTAAGGRYDQRVRTGK